MHANKCCGIVFAFMIVAVPVMASTALAAKLADAEKHMVFLLLNICTEEIPDEKLWWEELPV